MTEPLCPACGHFALGTEAERTHRLCRRCAKATGYVHAPVDCVVRPCPKCNHDEFIRTPVRCGAMVATLGYELNPQYVEADFGRPIAVLVAHVCRSCGFTELFAVGHERLQVGPGHNAEAVSVRRGPDDDPRR